MAEESTVSESGTVRRASPWPLFVALGVVLSELGVLFGSSPVSVAGVLLLSASVVGILRESGYARSLWKPSAAVGALFTVVGAALYLATTYTFRGSYIGASGAVVLVASGAFWLYETERL